MKRRIGKLFVTTALLALVAGCASQEVAWYEERCERIGITKGTADFEKCIERDKDWIEETRRRGAIFRGL